MKYHHFVLVHGACHGAWSWYKLKHRLESAGHRVAALDLATFGTNMKSIHDVWMFRNYTEPLLELLASLGAQERVILVGHSLGGLNLALAADSFPKKISVTVFLAALMPNTAHRPSYVLEEVMSVEDVILKTKSSTLLLAEVDVIHSYMSPNLRLTEPYIFCPIWGMPVLFGPPCIPCT